MARYWNEHGGEPDGPGEGGVVKRLGDELPDGVVMLCEVELPYRHGPPDRFDAVVITEDAVIVVETKRYRGRVIFKEQRHIVDGEMRSDPIRKTNAKARRLQGRLWDDGIRGIWVGYQIVLAIPPQQLEVAPVLKNYVVLLDDAAGRLVDRDAIIGERNWNVVPVDIDEVVRWFLKNAKIGN